MFGLGAMEILIILVIAFLLFGPKELPEIGKQVGRAVKGFKETADDLLKMLSGGPFQDRRPHPRRLCSTDAV